ncbi:hypothetical protein BDY17DRAFT_314604 [Neohortaea acidophila]|uniref:Enoyl reductase (ER) domain-containing protein n=1 Tax=Neohortaea acidophila TaxID=245834 RepID=A0A6A6Q6G3_9PEZI|nr:uncharacterized protein BDY17DRAFT_314604 [Neohortaea acidophila]KAF2487661.1 hypothetical protein BDY17DRAFT_314604 [Neohortaea acidophila]
MPEATSKTMKAWQFASASPTVEANLKLNLAAPVPPGPLKPDQVLVRVLVVALNQVDYKFAEIPYLGRLIVGSPSTPAIDFAGRVAELPKGAAAGLEVGQLVYGRLELPTKFGTLAEYTVAPRGGCVPIPSGVSLNDAACVSSVALSAYQSIVPKVQLNAGKRVFINGGSGGCGTFGIQIAKLSGCHVTVTCSTPNVALCKSLGADVVIDYKQHNVVAELKRQKRFDLVVDNVGEPADLYWTAHEFTTPGARFVQLGSGAVSVGFILGNLFKTHAPTWLGGGQRPFEFLNTVNKAEDFAQLSQWLQEGKLRTTVDEIFDVEVDGPIRAYSKLRTGRTKGKILVKMWGE